MRDARRLHQEAGSAFCRPVFILVLLAAILAWQPAGAAGSKWPTIAVLEVEYVLRKSNAGKALQAQIDKIRSANQEKDRKSEEDLRAEDEKLRKQHSVLSHEAYAQKRKELQSRMAQLQKDFEARRQRIQSGVDQAWFQIRNAMLEVTAKIASERKIDIVFERAGTVLLANNLNITKDVMTGLNDKLSNVTLTIKSP